MKLSISVFSHTPEWITATVEDDDGQQQLGTVTAPVVDGATFDTRAAVIRAATEKALAQIAEENR